MSGCMGMCRTEQKVFDSPFRIHQIKCINYQKPAHGIMRAGFIYFIYLWTLTVLPPVDKAEQSRYTEKRLAATDNGRPHFLKLWVS